MMHPIKVIQDAIICYCLPINHLINDPKESTRAQDAFNIALQYVEMMDSKDTVFNWITIS